MPTTSIQGTLSSTSDEIEIPTGPNGAVGIQIVLTGTATLLFTTTSDGATHNAILASPNGGGALVSSATASGAWRVNAVSTQSLRVKPSAISGSAVVTLIAQPGQVPTTPQGSSAVIGTVAIDQTTPGTTNKVQLGPAVEAQDNYTLCLAANSTQTGTTFPALAPTATAPVASASRCVITWAGRDNLVLIPFGVGSDNNTFKVRVTGWSTGGTNWYPNTLFDFTGQMSTITGISGQTPDNTNRFCDTITSGVGIGAVLASPADDTGVASVVVPIGQCQRVEVQFIRNGSATSVNAFYLTY